MRDPVCGAEVEGGDRLVHRGQEYAFCCASCRWAFERDPDRFALVNSSWGEKVGS
ncbi:MAG: YHS domain-containing protein [Thaumarchaeota archaeon]|nr:YHS domain-containing protein [Nitrososphaerota archaeon]